MDWFGTAVVFTIVVVDPVHGSAVRRSARRGRTGHGHERSGQTPNGDQTGITTLLAALVTALVAWLMHSGLIHLRPVT